MASIERIVIDVLLNFFSREEINAFVGDPQNAATIIGCLIAVSGALLGTFLLLRGMALTSDAISHTVLLGIVIAFMLMVSVLDQEPDLSSPWLIIGAAAAGVVTVVLTEMIYRTGLVRQDAALGLTFPLLFAIAVILVSRYVDDAHMDEDAVMVGEIGLASINTNNHCFANCESVTITPDHPEAKLTVQCTNCRELAITRRDEGAEVMEICTNCRTYTPGQAWKAGFIDSRPVQVFWPKSITVTALMTLLTVGFVTLFYKELKLATFDAALAKALGFRPGMLHYALMVLVSLVAVAAFDAVGSILVIAFFIIPAAAAYLLTDRLSLMLGLSALIGSIGAYFGYDLARGDFLGVVNIDVMLAWLNETFGLNLIEEWDSSISASMVIMMFMMFVAAWIISPKYGLVSTMIRRYLQRRRFANQVLLGHVFHHQNTANEAEELAVATLYQHFQWSPSKTKQVIARLRLLKLIRVDSGQVTLTQRGTQHVQDFRHRLLDSERAEV